MATIFVESTSTVFKHVLNTEIFTIDFSFDIPLIQMIYVFFEFFVDFQEIFKCECVSTVTHPSFLSGDLALLLRISFFLGNYL